MFWLKKYASKLSAFWLMVFLCALISGTVAHHHDDSAHKTSKNEVASTHGKVISQKADDCLFCHGFLHFSGENFSAEKWLSASLPPEFGSVTFYAVFGFSEVPSALLLRGPPVA